MKSASVDKNRKIRYWAYTTSILLHLILLPLVSRINLEGRRKFVGLIAQETVYIRPIDSFPNTNNDQTLIKTELKLEEVNKPVLKPKLIESVGKSIQRPKPEFFTDSSLDLSPEPKKRGHLLTEQKLINQIVDGSIRIDSPGIQPDNFWSTSSGTFTTQTTQKRKQRKIIHGTLGTSEKDLGQFNNTSNHQSLISEIKTRELRSDSPQISVEIGLDTSQKGRLINDNLVGGGQSTNISTIGSSPASDYPSLMRSLALNLITDEVSKKIDLVFILDKTASMTDNIRAIRAYMGRFLDQFHLAKRDIAVGLVSFSDRQYINYNGLTKRFRKFNKWMQKIQIVGGGDLAESGLDAIMVALEQTKFRRNSQPIFVFISDGTFHDSDYDGQSPYSLDQVITKLQKKRVRVESIGIDYLPVKQLAIATGGNWYPIPGRGYMEDIDSTSKTLSKLGVIGENIIMYVQTKPRPEWIEVHSKLLNPSGEKIPLQKASQKIEVPNDGSETLSFKPNINLDELITQPGTYTAIYRLINNNGQQSILRQTIEY